MNTTMKAILLFITLNANFSYAFKLDPSSKPAPSNLYVKKFFAPIHENLTVYAINSAKISEQLKNDKTFLSEIIKGVRWNDDPLNMARKRPQDFYIYYKDSCWKANGIDPSWDMLYRTHCGDMQFLHAMASKKNEAAGNTSELMLMWAEFSYRVAAGDIDKDLHFRSVGTKLERRSAKLFNYIMTYNGRVRMEWQPEFLFTLDCTRELSPSVIFSGGRATKSKCKDNNNKFSPETIQNIALGSLLHLLQDSFSGSHVLREGNTIGISQISGAGKIIRFGLYNVQDESSHGKADVNIEDKYEHKELSLIDISAKLIELTIHQRTSGKNNWNEAEELLKMVFEVNNPNEKPDAIGYDITKR
ncbi:hypothetical protein [Aeromonas caviae]|uniref:hypothetical protein n=2 Tax=Aeromonas caviae TaxID=648 RepID=UPI0021E07871|nr:hypothetical protein [Aeromonas caviae]MCU9922670.1 hypothetical protein [Aeromonas caviae]